MWAMFIPLISSMLGENGPLGQYFKTKAQTVLATQQAQLEIKKAEITMATEVAKANVLQSQNQLAATSQTFKAFSYALLTIPIIIVCIAPAYGKDIFNHLALIPVWYAQLYVAVVGVIWGLPIASSAVSGIFSAVQQSWLERQPIKIEKLKVLNEKVLAEQLRKNLFQQGMTEQQWLAILNATKSAQEE